MLQAEVPPPGVQEFGMAAAPQLTTAFGAMLLNKMQESHEHLDHSMNMFITEQRELNKTLQ